MNKQCDILGLGGVAVDDFIFVESYPPADAKVQVLRRERHCGGLTATALITAARLGARCAYAGVLGKDDLSGFALGHLARGGIDTTRVRRVTGARPIYSNIVVDLKRGTRNIFYDLRQVIGADDRSPPETFIRACRVLFVDNIGVRGMVRAARVARRAGIPVVADFDSSSDPQFTELFGLADHIIVSRSFARHLSGIVAPARAVRALRTADHQVVVVTCGDTGCWYLEKGSVTPRHQPAFAVKAVDTTGCGDVFHGAYAAALAQGVSLAERVRFAAAAAALKARQPGGQAGIPSLAEVQSFLRHHDEDGRA